MRSVEPWKKEDNIYLQLYSVRVAAGIHFKIFRQATI